MKSTFLAMSGVLALTIGLVAQSAQLRSEAFSWHGELVSLDESARVITVKSSVVGEQARAQFGRLKSGERVMLTWSGYDQYADAIRDVRPAGATKAEERFTFAVDFVSFDPAHNYATFKVPIPESSIVHLKPLKPGEWVTATSPHGLSSKSAPVLTVRPYGEPASTANSN